jgi:hypothetical protein
MFKNVNLLTSCWRRLALRTRADFPQQLPRIETEIVVIVPLEADGILTHRFSRDRLGRRLEHWQNTDRGFGRFSRLSPRFVAFLVAHGAGAGVAEIDEVVVGDVAVGPFDVHPGAGRKVNLYRLRICCRSGGLKRGLHNLSIAYGIKQTRGASALVDGVSGLRSGGETHSQASKNSG